MQGEVAKDPRKKIAAYAVAAVLFMVLLWCAFGGVYGEGAPVAATAAEAAKQAVTSN